MSEDHKLGGNITLSGFDLEAVEMIVVRKIIGSQVKKLSEICDYDSVNLTMRKSQHGKAFLHDLKANVNLKSGAPLVSEVSDYNLYTALSEILNKIIKQAEHNLKQ